MKPINTISGKNSELLSVKAGGTYSYHCASKDYKFPSIERLAKTINLKVYNLVTQVCVHNFH
jgi:hypothetical protein